MSKHLRRLSANNGQNMMATIAIHKLGDISRDKPDLCAVFRQDKNNFYGNWVTGFGFVDVRFPKSTTRKPNKKERAYWASRTIHHSNGIFHKIKFGAQRHDIKP